MTDEKPIEVEATIIEAEISPLAGAERWLAGASERVAERCELYRPPKAIANDTQRKDAMAARAQVRKDVAEIDAERKAMLRSVEDGLKRFKASVKDVLSPLTDLDAEYKELLDAYEAQWKADRELELAQEYEAIAPDLVPLVPFRTILARYGQQRGKVWTNRSTNVEAAKDMLADAVEDIAGGERTVDELVDDEDREAIKARYFQTLDLQGTLAEARQAKEQRERVRRLEEERRARELQARLEREERERAAAEEAARQEAERAARAAALEAEYAGIEEDPYDYEPAEAVAPAPTPAPVAPAPVPHEKPATIPAPPRTMAEANAQADAPRHWVVDVPSATRKQMEALASALSSLGLNGTIRAVNE